MRKNDFWFINLCVLLILSVRVGLNPWLRIAIGANAVIILSDVIKDIRRIIDGRKEA